MFALLDVKSSYSFLDGVMSVQDIVKTAHSFNYAALAINDLDNLHNLMELKMYAEKYNIKPIYSLRVELTEPDPITYLLYAKDNQAYLDLLEYSSLLNSDDYENSFNELAKFSQNAVVIIYGEGGIIESEQVNTKAYLELYQAKLKDFYIGISNNSSNKWKIDNDELKLLCHSLKIETVALPKVDFLEEADKDLKKLSTALKYNRPFNDHANYVNEKNFFLSKELIERFYDQADIDNTIVIANKCNVNFNTLEKAKLPKFASPNNLASEDYLVSLCVKGLELRRNNQVSYEYSERLKYELSIINQMGFADYFLIVYDIILFARKNDIYVGPGRGSSAGSLVAYVLGITHIDPIENSLLFERFLNPERISLPDIDIDFPDNRRQDIIDYVVSKYGYDHVAQIVTFGTFAARQALRDVGKALMIPSYKLDALSNLIKESKQTTLADTYKYSNKFKKEIDNDNKLSQLYKLASKLEGLNRHTSIHAAGIVLSADSIYKHVPIIRRADTSVSQYSMNYLEELGLNKIDLLGLRNLAIIAEVASSIENFEILKIPLNDQKTFELLQSGDTAGIFQLESYGMSKLIKDMGPSKYTELVAAIALYRPGPVKNIPTFLENRKDPSKIVYMHKKLEPILAETYGVIVYQEQIMQIAQVMANFSLAKADIMRKAMASKQADLLVSMREEFILGSLKMGYTKTLAVQIYDLIEEFSNYGFNKAHSYAYGLIAYQMAYLKANHYLEFYLALLNGSLGADSKTSEYVQASKQVGINIFGPNINYSQNEYIKSNNSILFPLSSIKGIGKAIVNKLLAERSQGLFTDYFDFIARSNLIGISKGIVEALIYAGALDLFDYNRTTMISMLDQAYMYANLVKVDVEPVRLDFDIVSKPQMRKLAKDSFKEMEMEKHYLGLYLSTHPISEYKESINYQGDSILSVKQSKRTRNLLGLVKKVKTHRTKYGDLMAFIALDDETSSIDIVLMPNVYKLVADDLKIDQYVTISGKINQKDSILVDRIEIRKWVIRCIKF